MSLDLADLSEILLTNFGPFIAEGITQRGPGNDAIQSNSLWGLLAKYGCIEIGAAQENATKPMDWAVHSSTQEAVSYGKNDAYGSYTPEGYDSAQLDWKRWGTPFAVDDLVSWALAKQGGAVRGNADAIKNSIMRRLKALVDKGNAMLATDGTGNSSKDLTGFKAALAASGSYAGIALTETYWAPNVTAVGGPMTTSLMDSMFVSLEDDDGITDKLVIVMRRNQWHRWKNLFASKIEYRQGDGTGDALQPVWSDGDITANIEIVSGGMPNNEIWFLNMGDIRLFLADQIPHSDLKSNADTIMHQGIPIGVKPIYENTDISSLWFRIWGQLAFGNPRMHGAYLTLTA